MRKDSVVYFEDILESIQKIEEYTNTLTKEKFSDVAGTQDAVLMRLIVIGETANKIQTSIKNKYKEIPWRKIINLRNLIVHDYTSININRIWRILKESLPRFKKQMKELLEETT